MDEGILPWWDGRRNYVPDDETERAEWPWRVRVVDLQLAAEQCRFKGPIVRLNHLLIHLAFALAKKPDLPPAEIVSALNCDWRTGEKACIQRLLKCKTPDAYSKNYSHTPVVGFPCRDSGGGRIGQFLIALNWTNLLNKPEIWSVPVPEWHQAWKDFWGIAQLGAAIHRPKDNRTTAIRSILAWRASIIFSRLRWLYTKAKFYEVCEPAWVVTSQQNPFYRFITAPTKLGLDELKIFLPRVRELCNPPTVGPKSSDLPPVKNPSAEKRRGRRAKNPEFDKRVYDAYHDNGYKRHLDFVEAIGEREFGIKTREELRLVLKREGPKRGPRIPK